jgi:hypothetical protein
MSPDVQAQTGQAPAAARHEAAATAGGQTAQAGPPRESPPSLIQESIKYRRRAQEAERRAEALEAELAGLREAEQSRAAAVEGELAQARSEAETLRTRLQSAERDRRLERELSRAGCIDAETALAVAHERLASGDPPDDLAAFARSLLEEKPHLRGTGGPPRADAPLPPRTSGAKPAGDDAPRRAADRLAEQARQTGSPRDVLAYVRARRGVRT